MKKRVLIFSFVVVLLLALSACNNGDDDTFDASSYIKDVSSEIKEEGGIKEVFVTVTVYNTWESVDSPYYRNRIREEVQRQGSEETDKYIKEVDRATLNAIDEDGKEFNLELEEQTNKFDADGNPIEE